MVVLNYNGARYLETCLESVLAQEIDGEFEVIVVDNGSQDGSRDLIGDRFTEVRLIDAGRNLGYAAGNNLGISAAGGTYVVLLNNDTRVRPGWLAGLIAAVEGEASVGAVTGKLVFADRPQVIQSAGTVLLSDGGGGDRGYGEVDDGQFDAREEVFGANGASALLRREMLADVGRFDESFFMYYEDTDLSWRMRLRGWRVVYEPSAVVEHVHVGSDREGSPQFLYRAYRNRLFMLVKNASPRLVRSSLLALGRRAGGGSATGRPVGRGLYMKVMAGFAYGLPRMLLRRWSIRHRRRVDDGEIERWLYPRDKWDSRGRSG